MGGVAVKKPDIPHDEQVRLETLRSLDVLDSLAEDRFDRLTRMAKRMFNVPIALVSLVDENRQWFKSCIGLDVSETSRDISFCGHAILGNEIFVIPDAAKDERFADNPLVLNEPGFRFYAGCPLKVINGSKIGTLCIIDRVPRIFSQEDAGLLKDLAGMVEKELTAVHLATVDEMTAILNRRGFMGVANKLLPLCIRKTIPATLVFFDLNNFKSVNDMYGHAEGDRALVAFAEQLVDSFRESDAVARLGGDEFVVLLTGTSKEFAENIIAEFRAALEESSREAGRGYSIMFSHGIVEFDPERHRSIEGLLARADSLMYEHKMQQGAGTRSPGLAPDSGR